MKLSGCIDCKKLIDYRNKRCIKCRVSITHSPKRENGYCREFIEGKLRYTHVLVWERTHGMKLPKGWIVHHINENRQDNRPANLWAMPRREHTKLHNHRRPFILGKELLSW